MNEKMNMMNRSARGLEALQSNTIESMITMKMFIVIMHIPNRSSHKMLRGQGGIRYSIK